MIIKINVNEEGRAIGSWLKQFHKNELKNAVILKIDGVPADFNTEITKDMAEVEIITGDSPEGLEIIRHSVAHLMAQAVIRLFPDAIPTIGPSIESGFYYDFDTTTPITEADLPKIEAEMAKIVKENMPITCEVVSREEMIDLYTKRDNKYKVEILSELEDEKITFYTQGDFSDLCRGPHVSSTGKNGAFKLLSIAGAYWRGDEKNKMLTRIYGTAFATKDELQVYLTMMEEAKKRDHKKLGRELGLFLISPEIGAGLPLWLPKGAIVRTQLETFLRNELKKRGYYQVMTPVIGKLDLYRTSGHYPYYKDSQFPPIIDENDDEGFLLRPMNCPHHIMIYKAEQHSYRDLPLRLAEFGNVYRYEQSGELSGLTRVRGFTQDDAHIFLTPEQLDAEFKDTVNLVLFVFRTLGLNDYRVRVSVREEGSDKYIGDLQNWEISQNAIIKAVTDIGMDYEIGVGEAAFYGPKLDFLVKDSIGREWQLGTIQVDYNLPERFDIDYIGEDGEKHRPVMIHRAPFGSLERFFGLLIEHFAGAFPVWMAPVQVAIIPISERHNEYAQEIADMLKKAGLRAKFDDRNESMKYKIRAAQMEKIPYMLILGDKEMEERSVGLRSRVEGDLGAISLDELVNKLSAEAEIPSSD